MFYDVAILSLMIVGITGMVVYSYKMSRSRVYPVGIVRKATIRSDEAAESIPGMASPYRNQIDPVDATITADLADYLAREMRLGVRRRSAREYRLMMNQSHHRAISVGGDLRLWSCPKCGSVQATGKDFRCGRCAYALKLTPAKENHNPAEGRTEEAKTSLQTQVTQHDRTLLDFEERIRKLEKASVVQRIDERQAERAGAQDWQN